MEIDAGALLHFNSVSMVYHGTESAVRGRLSGDIHDAEGSLHLSFDKERSTFEATISVLVEDGSMMLSSILAALENEASQGVKLGKGIAGPVNMSWGL